MAPSSAEPIDEPTPPDELDNKWRISSWLANRGVAEAIAFSMIPELANSDPTDDPDELQFLRALAREAKASDMSEGDRKCNALASLQYLNRAWSFIRFQANN